MLGERTQKLEKVAAGMLVSLQIAFKTKPDVYALMTIQNNW